MHVATAAVSIALSSKDPSEAYRLAILLGDGNPFDSGHKVRDGILAGVAEAFHQTSVWGRVDNLSGSLAKLAAGYDLAVFGGLEQMQVGDGELG